MVLPAPCLVVLVGPSGSGKSSWAATHFAPEQIVSSDALRAVVGAGDADLSRERRRVRAARTDRGCPRRPPPHDGRRHPRPRRRPAGAVGCTSRRHRVTTVCVAFATRAVECKARNRARGKSVPDRVLSQQVRALAALQPALAGEGFDIVLEPTVVRTAPAANRAVLSTGGTPGNRADVPAIWPQRPRVSRPGSGTAAATAGDCGSGRSRRLHQHLGDGPFPPDPNVRSAVGVACSRATRRSRISRV